MNILIFFSVIISILCLGSYDIGYFDLNNIYEGKLIKGTTPWMNELDEKTIRDICYNNEGYIALDSNYQIYTIDDLFVISTPVNFTVDAFFVKNLPSGAGKPKKVVCTSGSFFVLTFDGELFGFGSNNNGDLGQSTSSSSDAWVEITALPEVLDVFAGKDVWYAIVNEFTGNGTGNLHNIYKPHATLGVTKVDLSGVDSVASGQGYPKVQVIDNGVLLTYTTEAEEASHYFAGKSHPSNRTDTSEKPLEIDFRSVASDQILNEYPIDWIVRPTGKCGVIASMNLLYAFGDNCNGKPFTTPGFVAQLSRTKYNDYDEENSAIIDIVCNTDCYMLAAVGTTIKFYKFGDTNTIVEMSESESAMMPFPKVGGSGFHYFQTDFSKIHKPSTDVGIVANEYQPEITKFIIGEDETGAKVPGKVVIEIQKDTVFYQRMPKFYLGLDNEQCAFETDGEQTMWSFEENAGTTDVYTGVLDWSVMNLGCGWTNDTTSDDLYIIFTNTIYFEERFFVKYIRSVAFNGLEEYEMGLKILMSKQKTFEIEINVKKAPFVPYITIYEKKIDEFNKRMDLKLRIETITPIHLVYVNHTYTNLNDFDHTALAPDGNITYVRGITVESVSGSKNCDDLHCYQTYHVQIDYEQCNVATVITINNLHECDETNYPNHPDCVALNLDTDPFYEFDVIVNAEEVCVIEEVWINATVDYGVYRDWQREEKYDDKDVTAPVDQFNVGEYVYFTFTVTIPGSEVQLERVYFEYVKVYDKNDVSTTLYKDFGKTTEGGIAAFRDDTEDLDGMDSGRMLWTGGFQFRLVNEYLNLGFGEESDIKVEVKVVFEFVGNVRRSIISTGAANQKSRSGHRSIFKVVSEAQKSVGGIIAVISVTVGLALILAVSGIVLGIFFFMKKRGKKNNEVVLKE